MAHIHRPASIAVAILLVPALAALALVTTAAAHRTADDPNLPGLSLVASDFAPGTTIAKQRFMKPAAPAASRYVREFASGTRFGSKRLLLLESDLSLFADGTTAKQEVLQFRSGLATADRRAAFGKVFGDAFTKASRVKLKRVAVSAPTSLGAGQSSVHSSVTLVLVTKAIFTVHFVVVQTDRAVALLLLLPAPDQRFGRSDVVKLAQVQSGRFREGFTIVNTTAPAITGTATQGQTLSTSTGGWLGAPSSYAYQWSRCDASATTCTDIGGATRTTYTVAAEDAGSVLRVSVTSTNTISSGISSSTVTAVVP